MLKELLLSESEVTVLKAALDLYFGLGLGRLSEVGRILPLLWHSRSDVETARVAGILAELESDLLIGRRPWTVRDKECSLHTLIAFAVRSRLLEDYDAWKWASRRVRRMKADLDL
jgi:hypothetical protein